MEGESHDLKTAGCQCGPTHRQPSRPQTIQSTCGQEDECDQLCSEPLVQLRPPNMCPTAYLCSPRCTEDRAMRGFPWLKLWIEDMDDDRFEVAADVARSTRAAVWSAYSRLLRLANKNEDRGSIAGLHPLAIASWCQVPLDEIQRIIEAF